MHSPTIRVALLALTLAPLAACSKSDQNGGRAQEDRASDASSPPNVSPSAAPGVAFNFAYDFNLPDERISTAQEAHAQECEKLGLARCRITGMSYSLDQNEQVNAELDLKLDPAIARQFGKSAQQLVQANDGKLIRLQIGSSDEGQAIQQASQQKSEAVAQMSELQKQLAKAKPGSAEHADLLSQIQSLQQQATEQSHAIQASQAVLASTPMAFHYYGRGGVPGFRTNPMREAWHTFMTIVVALVGMFLQAIAVLIPAGLLIALLIALWRTRPVRAAWRWIKGPQEETA